MKFCVTAFLIAITMAVTIAYIFRYSICDGSSDKASAIHRIDRWTGTVRTYFSTQDAGGYVDYKEKDREKFFYYSANQSTQK
jgi:hypothetical protein